jgi:hypothetical protein
MIGNIMGARWVVLPRRLTETIAATLPLTAALFVPLLFGLREIYPWAAGTVEHLDHGKAAYFATGAFVARSALYLVAWSALALLLRRRPSRALSAAGLPLVALTLTFASFDWLMSLQTEWTSAAFGVYVFAGGFAGAFALLIVLLAAADRAGHLADLVRPSHYHALGRLLFGFIVFWAYIAYFQYFLIAIADKPEEVTFFVRRTAGGWRAVNLVLILGHFALPFLALLPREVKRARAPLATIAAWVLLMHVVDVYWLVMPTVHPDSARPHWLDVAALLGVGGLVVGFGSWLMRGRPLVPLHDPAFEDAVRYRSL